MASKFFISVIMPALNEENNIIPAIDNTLAAFNDLGIEGEIIVVNDGSNDRTHDIAKDLMLGDTRIHLIDHRTPQGIGASFWDGVDNAQGEIVSMFPGDNENDPHEILRYSKLLEHVDMVIPFVYNKDVRPPLRNFLSRIYTSIINITFGLSLNYTNGTILYRRGILNGLAHRNRSFFFQTDILTRLVKMGYLFAEVPYSLGTRKSGKSRAISFSSFFRIVRGYLRLVKDIYFRKKTAVKKYRFSNGSLSAQRYKDAGALDE